MAGKSNALWLRQIGTKNVIGPFTEEDVLSKIGNESITTDTFECHECSGQAAGEINLSKQWTPLSSLVPACEVALAKANNQYYLDGVRKKSCYARARWLHGVMTGFAYSVAALAAYAGTGMLMMLGVSVVPGLVTLFFGAMVLIVVAIERALFDALIDTADVVIDIGRRNRNRESV